ncbi:hypothetical protein [Natrinema sp. 1APR25-10V2]|uniref:hypothetical protein n=1 Tax=Natrinema sp. 1APR25-10V2 TaxID=2951081 RepID=UPI002874BFC7|nr:hypothetical protein [Natrinema sp. 1APR25-10V2]MDS0476270.1 hypothetical protein [Natrinema sp. 1APR25-10V2]
MSSDRRFEYDKGPQLEDERESDAGETGGDSDDGDESADERYPRRRRVAVPPWKVGAVSGIGAFVVVVAVTYQLVGAMFAGGLFSGIEDRPSRAAITGLVALGSHGATIERGNETIQGAYGVVRGLTTNVTALVPVVVLLVTGYLLVRIVRLETRREAGLALGSLLLSYVVLTAGLATVARWTPEGGGDVETLAVSIDPSLFAAVGGTAVVFTTIGAGIAALPRQLATER